MGFCEYRLSHYGRAEERCQVALKLLDVRQQPGDVAQVYSVLGLVRWKTSRYDEAEQYFRSSMALREKLGDRLAMARIYNNLGLLERSRRRFAEALEFHRKSMDIRQELDDHEGVARSLHNLAWAHYEMQDHARAEELAVRAARRSRELGLRSLNAAAKGLQGEIYLELGRYDAARQALQEAIDTSREVGDQAELFMHLRKLATVELRCHDTSRAAEILKESEQYLPHAASPLEEANWYLTQADLRIALKDTRGAAASFEHAGNNFARLGLAQRAGEVFVKATRGYKASGVRPRARELATRARELLTREGAVLPKDLVDLEAQLGTEEKPLAAAVPEAARLE
jgi:tetratricopeptide (TPR) repeat protein